MSGGEKRKAVETSEIPKRAKTTDQEKHSGKGKKAKKDKPVAAKVYGGSNTVSSGRVKKPRWVPRVGSASESATSKKPESTAGEKSAKKKQKSVKAAADTEATADSSVVDTSTVPAVVGSITDSLRITPTAPAFDKSLDSLFNVRKAEVPTVPLGSLKRARDDGENEDKETKESVKASKSDENAEESIETVQAREAAEEKKEEELRVIDPTRVDRTIFVGNVPAASKAKDLKLFFKKHGKVESIRFRSVAYSVPAADRKEAHARQQIHADRKSKNAYLVFESEAFATAALAENGEMFEGHHLRVDNAKQTDLDHRRSVFVGNLPFKVEDEDVIVFFNEHCAPVDAVRIIRDKQMNIGKGFGYVQFQDADSVVLALNMKGQKFQGRELRITRAMPKAKVAQRQKKIAKINAAAGNAGGQARITAKKQRAIDRDARAATDASSFQGQRAVEKPGIDRRKKASVKSGPAPAVLQQRKKRAQQACKKAAKFAKKENKPRKE